jgi:DNA-binding response OmpR family regulator
MMLHDMSAIVAAERQSCRTILCEILRAGGMRDVQEAVSNEDAFVRACQRPPSLVVFDAENFSLALTTLQSFRACGQDPVRRLPILVATSPLTLPQAVALRDAGVDEIVVKPFNTAKVLARVDAATTYRRDFIETERYIGPDRRRHLSGAYRGPFRRADDAVPDVLEIA